jgi:microcin C transport system substrate-binding protein
MEVKMNRILSGLLLISFLSVVSCCNKEASSTGTQIQIANEEELMEKYGPKYLSQEQVDSVVKSIKWTTNKTPSILGSKNAKKGGTLIIGETGYPASLRTEGENSSYVFNSVLKDLIYETLMDLDPITLEYIPVIADRWCMKEDKKTFFFRVNPTAKWQDDRPVTSFDFVATWDLLINDALKEPFSQELWNKYERPVALSKDIIMVKAKSVDWRLFLYISSSFYVLPEHIIGKLSAEAYIKDFNTKMLIGTGPYIFEEAKVNESLTLKRNPNWWGYELPYNRGFYNFDRVKFIFYTEEKLVEENFKKGSTDIYFAHSGVVQKWVNEFIPEKMNEIKYNHIIKQKIHTQAPASVSIYAFNMRKEPFNDIRVRKAFYMLIDREKILDKFYYNQYRYLDSYHPNSFYENKNNPKIRYNPEEAIELLGEAGYSQKSLNEEGYIVKDGEVFELTLNVINSGDTRVQTFLQEAFKSIGIKINLKNVSWAAHSRDLDKRNFKIIGIGYTSLLFPNPEHVYHSKYADQENTNNIWGLKNKRVDEICEEYNDEFDIKKRIKLIRELDSILTSQYMSAFTFYSDDLEILYWNKFDMPEFVLDRIESLSYWEYMITKFWWYDEKADKALQEAKGKDIMLPGRPYEIRYWEKYR